MKLRSIITIFLFVFTVTAHADEKELHYLVADCLGLYKNSDSTQFINNCFAEPLKQKIYNGNLGVSGVKTMFGLFDASKDKIVVKSIIQDDKGLVIYGFKMKVNVDGSIQEQEAVFKVLFMKENGKWKMFSLEIKDIDTLRRELNN